MNNQLAKNIWIHRLALTAIFTSSVLPLPGQMAWAMPQQTSNVFVAASGEAAQVPTTPAISGESPTNETATGRPSRRPPYGFGTPPPPRDNPESRPQRSRDLRGPGP